jgi:DNA recombination protein RmuC
MAVVLLLVGLALGAAATWLVVRERLKARKRVADELALTFKALSAEALHQNSSTFLQLAEAREKAVEQLVLPLKESLAKVDEQVRALEVRREGAYRALNSQVELLTRSQDDLRRETSSLVRALRSPAARGQWGEMQLRRALEMAGMLAYCDFVEQQVLTRDERLLRPDVIVRLAGGKHIVVDAKVPLEALLDAFDAEADDVREARLDDFVRHVRDHVAKLSAKAYWQQFERSPEFVVMFLASESFFRYAVERDPALLEAGPKQRVILASPTTLISLLFAAAAGWREERLADSARQVSRLGQELYERLATMGGHVERLGSRLEKAVEAYNETVGSLEARVLPAARRFPELGVPAKSELPELKTVERAVKPLTALELTPEQPERLEAHVRPDEASAA